MGVGWSLVILKIGVLSAGFSLGFYMWTSSDSLLTEREWTAKLIYQSVWNVGTKLNHYWLVKEGPASKVHFFPHFSKILQWKLGPRFMEVLRGVLQVSTEHEHQLFWPHLVTLNMVSDQTGTAHSLKEGKLCPKWKCPLGCLSNESTSHTWKFGHILTGDYSKMVPTMP